MGATQQTGSPCLGPRLPAVTLPHLDVDEQLPQAPGWHHRGGVELGDVAFVQSDVVISCETLEPLLWVVKTGYAGVITTCGGGGGLTLWKSWMMSAGSLPPKCGTGMLICS